LFERGDETASNHISQIFVKFRKDKILRKIKNLGFIFHECTGIAFKNTHSFFLKWRILHLIVIIIDEHHTSGEQLSPFLVETRLADSSCCVAADIYRSDIGQSTQ
jgi:hypothetical protein